VCGNCGVCAVVLDAGRRFGAVVAITHNLFLKGSCCAGGDGGEHWIKSVQLQLGH
jgi:hypothetical protein